MNRDLRMYEMARHHWPLQRLNVGKSNALLQLRDTEYTKIANLLLFYCNKTKVIEAYSYILLRISQEN